MTEGFILGYPGGTLGNAITKRPFIECYVCDPNSCINQQLHLSIPPSPDIIDIPSVPCQPRCWMSNIC